MHRPVHAGVVTLLALAVAAARLPAEDAAARKPERAVSPRVARMLAEAMPKFDPTPAAPSPSATSAARERVPTTEIATPANTIVRLPIYIVREPKLPQREEVLSRKELEKIAMQRYLGDEDGLMRTLNMFSVAGLWQHVPVLGKFPFLVGRFSGRHSGRAVDFQTNADRAMEMYRKEKIRERWEQLQGLESPDLKPGAAPSKKH